MLRVLHTSNMTVRTTLRLHTAWILTVLFCSLSMRLPKSLLLLFLHQLCGWHVKVFSLILDTDSCIHTNNAGEHMDFSFRPIAGNVNVCPRRLRGDRDSIDFDRLVSTIKHEILHTLVNIKTNGTKIDDEMCAFDRCFLPVYSRSFEIVTVNRLRSVIPRRVGRNLMMKSTDSI